MPPPPGLEGFFLKYSSNKCALSICSLLVTGAHPVSKFVASFTSRSIPSALTHSSQQQNPSAQALRPHCWLPTPTSPTPGHSPEPAEPFLLCKHNHLFLESQAMHVPVPVSFSRLVSSPHPTCPGPVISSLFMKTSRLFPRSSHGSTASNQLPYYPPGYTSKVTPSPLLHALPQLNYLGSLHHSKNVLFPPLCTHIPYLPASRLGAVTGPVCLFTAGPLTPSTTTGTGGSSVNTY